MKRQQQKGTQPEAGLVCVSVSATCLARRGMGWIGYDEERTSCAAAVMGCPTSDRDPHRIQQIAVPVTLRPRASLSQGH